jgi:indole-3-glycerol phosphate synthase
MDFLEKIIQTKVAEVAAMPLEPLQTRKNRPSFYQLVKEKPHKMHLIAEIKRASPSKGDINQTIDPVTQAKAYEAAGVSAISVLTDQQFFNGSLADLDAVSKVVSVPLLCKDFIIDKKQLIRAKNAGASLVLLIVAALEPEALATLYHEATTLGLEVLVETHNLAEFQQAQALGANIIGVNNRDLKTFAVSLDVSLSLAPQPSDAIYISESGIQTDADVRQLAPFFQGILVGETLMRSEDIADTAAGLQVSRP